MNLVLIEDDLNIQLALSQYFKNQSEFTNISVFNSAESYEAATLSHIPTIFLLDINTLQLPLFCGVILMITKVFLH